MKRLVLALGLVLMLIPVRSSGACTIITTPLSMAYRSATAVFIGEVVKIDKPLTHDLQAPLADRLYKVRFKVEFSWKGAGFCEVGLSEFVVLSDQGEGGDCFSWGVFLEGEKYLVFAEENAEKNFVMLAWNRTTILWRAAEDLKTLRRLDAPFLFPPKPMYY
jgi:hypothetical protein